MAVNPWCGTLALTTAATAYNLYTLGQAADPAFPRVAQAWEIQADLTAGAARFYVGNANVSATNRGKELTAGETVGMSTPGNDGCSLANIYITSDTNAVKINVMVIVL